MDRKNLYLKGGSMMYALLVICWIGTWTTLGLAGHSLRHAYAARISQKDKAAANLQSALQLFLNEAQPGTGSLAFSLFGSEQDSGRFNYGPWGLWEYVGIRGIHRESEMYAGFLTGSVDTADEKTVLVLEDKAIPLRLCGNSHIEGDCFLPGGEVEKGVVGGHNFEGEQLVTGNVGTSLSRKRKLPAAWMGSRLDTIRQADSQKSIDDGKTGGNKWVCDWEGKTLRIDFGGRRILQADTLYGRIICEATEALTVKADCQISHAILISPVIRIQKGFSGSVQLFASDSTIIESGAILKWPSAVVVFQPDGKKEGWLQLDSAAMIEGVVLVDSGPEHGKAVIRKDALIAGYGEFPGKLSFSGKLAGSMYVGTFALESGGSSYLNYLLDARLSKKVLKMPVFLPQSPAGTFQDWMVRLSDPI